MTEAEKKRIALELLQKDNDLLLKSRPFHSVDTASAGWKGSRPSSLRKTGNR